MPLWTYAALAVTFVAQVMGTMIMYAPAVVASAAQADLGVPASSVGVLTSICYVGATAATMISGQAISRLGPMRWSQICLLMMACGTGLIASANLLLVMAGGLILGAGYGPLTPASSAILVKRAPLRLRATILSVKQTGVPAGGALAGMIIPLLILAYGWKTAVLTLGGFCLLITALVQPTRKEFDRADFRYLPTGKQGILEPLRVLRTDPRLWEGALVSFIYAGMQLMFVSFFVVYLTQHVGLTLVMAGGAMAAGMIGSVVARLMWGVVADRWVRPRALLAWIGIGTSLATVTMALITPAWPLFSIYAVGIAMGMTSVAWNGVFLAEIARIAPKGDIGMATSASMIFTYGGVVFCPVLCWGLIIATGGYTAMFLIMAALNLLAALALFRRHA